MTELSEVEKLAYRMRFIHEAFQQPKRSSDG